MCIIWQLVIGLVVISMSVSYVESNHGGTHYCPRQYTVSAPRTQSFTYSCGSWWRRRRRCTCTRTYYVTETRTDSKHCCTGYQGNLCNIPICSNCQNNAVCLSPPNNCYCRPGSSGTSCELKYCSASNDCYPGTCFNGRSSCMCASGFSGSSCNIMQEGGTFRSCDVSLLTTSNGEEQTTLTATCGTRDPVEYTYWSNTGNLDYLVTNVELIYQNHDDLPPLPSEYMIEANFGLVQSNTSAVLNNNAGITSATHTITCDPPVASGQSPPSLNNPHQSMDCKNTRFRWLTSITHRDKLELELFSETGGFKEYKDPVTNKVSLRKYTGATSSQKVHINFDLETPVHCSESSSCEDEFTVPSSWIPDITKQNNPSLDWFGWNDTDSGIKDYRYTVYSMEIQNNQLTETTPYMLQERWTVLNDPPVIELEFRGMYSLIVEVFDFAGNDRKTRSVLLFDDTSEIETESNNPISIAEVDSWDSAFWFTQAGSAPIQITWENHFINRFLHDNKMLVEVKTMADVMDDNSGNRTIQAINNVQGIVTFEATYNKDASGGISTTPTHSYEDLGLDQAYEITEPRSDGDTIIVFIRATDPIGNTKEETVKIHTDATPATYLEEFSTLQLNAEGRDKDKPYVSGLSLNLLDVNSGIRNTSYNVVDTTTGADVLVYSGTQLGQRHPTYTQDDECVSSSECYCIPVGPCYNLKQVIEIDHCQLTEREGHSFRFYFTAVNGAGLQTNGSYDLHILDGLSGIGLFPPVQELRSIDANEFATKVTLAWYLLPVCYEVTGFKIIFIDGQTRRELEIAADKVTYEVADLSPGSLYIVDLIVLYEGGKQSPQANIAFSTPDDGGSGDGDFGLGEIIGIVIGAILLILLGAVIILLVVRYQQHKHPVPEIVRETTTRVRNRLSRLSRYRHDEPDMNINNLQKGAAYGINNNTYTVPYEEEGAIGGKKAAFNVVYGGEEDEDIYIYGNMETDPKAQWKVSDDKLIMGKALPGVKGKFADLKLATLQDKNGKSTVVAKMNKVNANEEDRLLMLAKMNFYGTDVISHEYLVNFIAAISPPQGPIMLFEYCPEGKLVDWLQSHSHITADVEDNLITFSVQISSAMTHLHTRSLLHRRLGARNVLLKNNAKNQLVAKVAGFGPMKGEQHGNDSKTKDRVPIKWMAPEQFEKNPNEKRLYTDHTDVWSYGITLHEIFNKGEAPYSDMKAGDVKEKVRNGYRLPKGNNCPDFIYEITTQCWDAKPDNRPGFESIERDLKKFYEGQGGGEEYYYDNHTKYTK